MMLGRKLMETLLVLPVAVLAACGDVAGTEQVDALGEKTQGVLYAPPPPASGNIRDTTTYLGPVSLGGAVQTSFTTNPQYYSFTVQVPASSRVSLEVTHAGSSMYLDTGLFLYGPKNAAGSYGTTVVAQDDDAGYGQLSKLAGVTLSQGGEYLVVVSAGSGAGKQFRLQTGCVAGACLPPSTLPPAPAGYQLTLTEQALTSQLESTLATGEDEYDWSTGSLRRFDFAWPYSGEPTLAQADAAVMGIQEYDYYYGHTTGTAITYPQFHDYLYAEFQPLHPQILSTYGNGLENVQVMTHYYTRLVAAGASGWFRLNIILFPQSKKIIVFEQTAYET